MIIKYLQEHSGEDIDLRDVIKIIAILEHCKQSLKESAEQIEWKIVRKEQQKGGQ